MFLMFLMFFRCSLCLRAWRLEVTPMPAPSQKSEGTSQLPALRVIRTPMTRQLLSFLIPELNLICP